MSVLVYRIAPGLSEAMSAWAKDVEQGLADRKAQEWSEGFQSGQQFERDKRGEVDR